MSGISGKQILVYTIYVSLLIQLITGVLTFNAVLVPLEEKDKILTDVALIELVVQIIEALWYIVIIYAIYSINNNTIAARRYIDWVITTPVMLISTILFFSYKTYKAIGKTITTREIFSQNKFAIGSIIVYNFFMLLFGFLGEVNILNKFVSIPVGFVFFALSFYTLYVKFVGTELINQYLFVFLFVVWGLYGFAAMFPTIIKNISYNVLDLIAKNFYGIFIYFYIRGVSQGIY